MPLTLAVLGLIFWTGNGGLTWVLGTPVVLQLHNNLNPLTVIF